MISLKKIIDRITRKKSQNTFNLRVKKASDDWFYSDEDEDRSPTSVIDEVVNPESVGLSEEDAAANAILNKAPALPGQEIGDIPRDLKEFVDNIIAKDVVNGPSALGPVIWQDPAVLNYFKESLKGSIDNFDEAIAGYTEKTVAVNPKNEMKIREALVPGSGGQSEEATGSDIVQLLTNKLKSTMYSQNQNALDFLYTRKGQDYTHEAISRYFGPPSGKTMDQRVNFFIHNENMMPEDIKNELYSWVEANNGVINKNNELKPIDKRDKYKYLIESGKAERLHGELKNIINNLEPGSEALTSVMKFLMGAAKWTERQELSKTQNQFQQIGVDDEGNSLDDQISNRGFERAQPSLEEQQESRNQNSGAVSFYADYYIEEVLTEAKALVEAVTGDVMNYVQEKKQVASALGGAKKDGEIKKLQKLQRKVEEMLFFVDAAIPHLKDIFDPESGKSTIGQSGNDMVYKLKEEETSKGRGSRSGGKKYRPGSMRVPMSEVVNVSKAVTDNTSLNPVDAARSDPVVQNALREYVKKSIQDGSMSWIPDFRKAMSYHALAEKYNDIGEVKQQIRRHSNFVKTNGVKEGIEAIISQLKLRDRFPNISNLEKFVESTLAESDESISKWINGRDYETVAFYTTIKAIMPFMTKYKSSNMFGDAAFKTVFNLFPVHDQVLQGEKEGAGETIDQETGERISYTNLYSKLTGGDISPLARLKLNTSPKGKANAKKKITDDPALNDKQKKIKLKELEGRWEEIGQYVSEAKIYYDKERDLPKKQKMLDKYKGDLKALISNQKMFKKDEFGRPMDSKAVASKKEEIRLLEEEISSSEAAIEEYKRRFEASPIFSKLSNARLFRMLYASYSNARDSVNRLNKIKNTYNSLKFASVGTKTVDHTIIKIKQDFVNKYSFLFD